MDNGKVIALCNQKGGVGKTTSAENIGVGLALSGKKVLLIDADAQASLTLALGYVRPDDLDATISDILMDVISDAPIEKDKAILHQQEGIDLLPAIHVIRPPPFPHLTPHATTSRTSRESHSIRQANP